MSSNMGYSDCIWNSVKTLKQTQSADAAISTFRAALAAIGSSHILITGVPLPQKKLSGLIQFCDWPHFVNRQNYKPDSSDLIIQKAIDWPTPFILREQFYHSSGLATAAGLPGNNLQILVIPAIANNYYQGVVVTTFKQGLGFKNIDSEIGLTEFDKSILSCLVSGLFIKLAEFERLPTKREGQLTNREKEVVSLSALGKKSDEIGKILNISNRTVIAHIQNASVKLHAANRTECVLQAIRYNQIGPGAGLGFYQIETEIYKIT